MKLYIANGSYYGTQADARKIDKAFEQVEVPTDKEGLIAYLNEHCTDPTEQQAEPAAAPEPRPLSRAEFDKIGTVVANLTDVEDFIQSANHAQVCSIFENVVHRSRELLQDRMNAVAADAGGSRAIPETPAEDLSDFAEDDDLLA